MTHLIQNFDALAENDLRRDALAIAEAGYEAINVGNALRRKVRIEDTTLHLVDIGYPQNMRSYQLAGRNVYFVGVGKCAFTAAKAIEEILGDRLISGIAIDVAEVADMPEKIETFIGTHPLPSETNEHATAHLLQFLDERTENELIIMLISGGGSTLLCSYDAPMTSAKEAEIFKELTAKGATIRDLNTVRKHLSRARGGGLARAGCPAEVLALVVSDVPGNDIAFISSGPTVRDTSTVADAANVLEHYNVVLPANAEFIETEKDEKYFQCVSTLLFLTNRDALEAMQRTATERGYTAEIITDHLTGEAREIGRMIIEKLHTAPAKTALLYAGESTVTGAASSSRGGRNQEMALAALEDIHSDELVLPLASDGHDDTDYAGAIGDTLTRAHAEKKNISPNGLLAEHRSYEFFSTTGDALQTGYTGSNVSDLIIALKL